MKDVPVDGGVILPPLPPTGVDDVPITGVAGDAAAVTPNIGVVPADDVGMSTRLMGPGGDAISDVDGTDADGLELRLVLIAGTPILNRVSLLRDAAPPVITVNCTPS